MGFNSGFKGLKAIYTIRPVPVAARSTTLVWGRSLAGIADSNPAGDRDVCLLCALSDRNLCVVLIIRPEESYRVWCVQCMKSQSPVRGGHDPERGGSATGKIYINYSPKTSLNDD